MTKRTVPTIIFDGDDTLWLTHYYFEQIKSEVATITASFVEPEVFIRKVDENSVAIGAQYGFVNERFPLALCQAYEFYCHQSGIDIDPIVRQHIWDLGWQVNEYVPEPMPFVYEVLDKLYRDYQLVLYTLGEEALQRGKLSALGLDYYFTESHVFPFLRKGRKQVQDILLSLALNPNSTWMVGNSLRSDIKPALELGLHCIWMLTDQWLFDVAEFDLTNVRQANSLREVLLLVEEI